MSVRKQKSKMIHSALWSIWLASGLLILILLGGIVTVMVKSSDLAYQAIPTSSPITHVPEVDEDVQEKINIVYSRRGYSNPNPTSEDEDDAPDMVRIRTHTRRPLRRIGKDFNPYRSYTIKHPNGTLTYVFPSPEISSSTTSTIGHFEDDNNPTTVEDREGSGEPLGTYPKELVDHIVNEHRTRFEDDFGDDMLNGDKLDARFDISNDQFFCDCEEKLIHPKEGLSTKNLRVMIVNTDTFKQGVRIETCRNEGKPCRFGDENTVCKQLYHYRSLVAVNLTEQTPHNELIRLPSACKCARVTF